MGPRTKLLPRALLLPALLVGGPALAVDLDGTIKGTVYDPDGLPVPNAEVLLESPDLLGARNQSTGTEGRYRFTTLPPGEYELTVKHPGFESWTSGSFRVALAASVNLDVTLAPKDSGEVITVVNSAPAVDVESTRTGVVLDARFLQDIPSSGRDYQSAIGVAPGVIGSGNANMHGGFDSANQFYIDGINTTDPLTNTFSMNMNYDAIESIQVITGGMDAEYGRSLGGAVNIVTKSGGNAFEGTVNLLYSTPSMVLAPELEGDDTSESLEQQLVLNLGGPIKKDLIWFYGSVQADRRIRTLSVNEDEVPRDLTAYPMVPRDWRSLYLFGKVTAQPTADHRVSVHGQTDPTWIDNVEQNPYVLPSGETVQNQGGWLGSVEHTFTPNHSVVLRTQLYYQRSVIDYFPILWKDCKNEDAYGACTDDFVGTEYMGQTVTPGWVGYGAEDFSSGEFPYASFNRRNRASVNSSLTFFGDLLGEHEAKIGVQAEWLRSYFVYPGIDEGIPYYTSTGDPADLDSYEPAQLFRYENNLESTFVGTISTVYVQDVYKPHRRLAIRPGVRVDWTVLKNDVSINVFDRVTAAPRFGVAYDLTGDGRTRIGAYYGRFYDSGFLVISDLLRSKSAGYGGYNWDAEAGDWSEEPAWSAAGTFLAHDDLKNPYSDEFNVGLSREVGKDFGLDLTFIYEEAHNFWEDDEVNLIWNDDGTKVIGNRNGTNEAIYRLRTPDDVYTSYGSVELTARKSWSDNWSMIASYTYSHAIGTNSADQATGVADIPEQRVYERGLLAYDIPHFLKVAGSYNTRDTWAIGKARAGWVLGWNGYLRSGATYRKLVWNNYYSGYYNYADENDGRYRLPARANLDLRAGLNLGMDRYQWMVGAEVFNVFNDRTITEVSQYYDPEATAEEQTFGEMLDRQDPRQMRIIVRGEF